MIASETYDVLADVILEAAHRIEREPETPAAEELEEAVP